MKQIQLNNVCINAGEPLFEALTLTLTIGWTGISGANGSGKTSLINYLRHKLNPEHPPLPPELEGFGSVRGPSDILFIPQIPRIPEEEAWALFASADNRDRRIISSLGIRDEWCAQIPILSQGQIRKMQIASALIKSPDVLILDEPENHLDMDSRRLATDVLREYEGIGLIIGHSRDIMNNLCSSTLLLHQGRGHFYNSSLETALEIYEAEEKAIGRQRKILKNRISKESMLLQEYKGRASKAVAALSKKGLAAKDHDSRLRIDAARLGGADKPSSKKAALQKKQIDRSQSELNGLRRDAVRKTGLTIRGQTGGKEILYALQEGALELYPGFILTVPELQIHRQDRILLKGDNGSGKSGLLRHIAGEMSGHQGLRSIPQEFSASERMELIKRLNETNDNQKGEILAYVSRMGSDPVRLITEPEKYLHADSPSMGGINPGSPGEIKKIALSMAFLEETDFLILDEAANHLDIFALKTLEEALENYPGAVLMVSHENSFCRDMTTGTWTIKGGGLKC